MEIAALAAFVAVADTASFSRAAERLFLTQPAVTKRVAALEGELGSALFDRIGRRVAPTEAGRALLPRARAILDQLEDSRRAIANLGGRVEGTLRVGTSHHIGLHRLPPLLRGYSRRYPAVRLDLRFLDSEEVCRQVERGELELGIVTLPLQSAPRLETERIWRDPLAPVCAPDHPLAAVAAPGLAELAAHPAILPAPGTFTRQLVERAFAERAGGAGRPLTVGLSTNYLETIKMLVAVGLGWSLLPATMVDAGLRELAVAELRLERALGLVRHRERTPSNAAAALVGMLRGEGGSTDITDGHR